MTIAIMQPYFLPYIGYFQLIGAVDKFVVYDDVNYINRGWVNRNNLLSGSQPQLFTVPLREASQNKLIREVEVLQDGKWQKKLLKTIQQSYQKAPCYQEVFPLLEHIITYPTLHVAELALEGLVQVTRYLGITTEMVPSSSVYENAELKAQDRILDICRREGASRYLNPVGGMELYSKEKFEQEQVALFFLRSQSTPYPQFKGTFVPWLSVVDVLMFNDKSTFDTLLTAYELI
jgi:hypothetical protein